MGKKIPLSNVIAVFVFTLIAISWGRNMFGMLLGEIFGSSYGDTHSTLILSTVVAALVAYKYGYKWDFIQTGIFSALHRAMPAIIILGIVGMLIGSWMVSGVVPAMIYYGLMILKPSIFYLAVCLICCVVSLATGTSWGTAGTVGIAFVGISQGLDMSLAITAGAIVSGAYFGDKMSPLSDTTNIAAASAGANLFDHIKHMTYSVTPALILSLILYGILGAVSASSSDAADVSRVVMLQEGFAENFNIHLGLMLPPIIVIVLIALKMPAFPALMAGVFLGCIAAVIWQGTPLGDLPTVLHYGFTFEDSSVVLPEIVELAERGGLDSMLWTISLIMCAMCLGGVMDSTGMLTTLSQALLQKAKTTGLLVLTTIITCVFMNMIAGDSCLTIVLTGRMFKEEYENRRLHRKNLSRALEDGGTMTSALIPWNSCGATMAGFLGVPTLIYLPYAFLNLLCPLISIFFGFTGITMHKTTDEEYAEIMREREEDRIAAEKQLKSDGASDKDVQLV
ncbi:Na+/H+ antiporter NhaC [Bacillota bacterium]